MDSFLCLISNGSRVFPNERTGHLITLKTNDFQEDTMRLQIALGRTRTWSSRQSRWHSPKNRKKCMSELWESQKTECHTVIKNNAFKEEAMTWKKCSLKMFKNYAKFNIQHNPNFLKKMHLEKKIGRKYIKMLISILSNHFLYIIFVFPYLEKKCIT